MQVLDNIVCYLCENLLHKFIYQCHSFVSRIREATTTYTNTVHSVTRYIFDAFVIRSLMYNK